MDILNVWKCLIILFLDINISPLLIYAIRVDRFELEISKYLLVIIYFMSFFKLLVSPMFKFTFFYFFKINKSSTHNRLAININRNIEAFIY